jgi:hypothetical protein
LHSAPPEASSCSPWSISVDRLSGPSDGVRQAKTNRSPSVPSSVTLPPSSADHRLVLKMKGTVEEPAPASGEVLHDWNTMEARIYLGNVNNVTAVQLRETYQRRASIQLYVRALMIASVEFCNRRRLAMKFRRASNSNISHMKFSCISPTV